uniref:Uncharacterized protein n=1 Tax=Timema tahoe TaxID=61484 RepID=A0A7R9FHL1_9NEOP|nr:unnamed protein product [Timema tahoe]
MYRHSSQVWDGMDGMVGFHQGKMGERPPPPPPREGVEEGRSKRTKIVQTPVVTSFPGACCVMCPVSAIEPYNRFWDRMVKEKLLNSEGRELRRALFSLKQIFQVRTNMR